MRIVRWRRAVHRVATRVGSHGHHGHTIRHGLVESLEIAVVERILAHRHHNGIDDLGV